MYTSLYLQGLPTVYSLLTATQLANGVQIANCHKLANYHSLPAAIACPAPANQHGRPYKAHLNRRLKWPLGRNQIWLRRKLVTTNLGSYTEFSAVAPPDR
jgi:hypothetical protein